MAYIVGLHEMSQIMNSFAIEHTCDMIKGNESDVANIVFEILGKTAFKFLCLILFLALTNLS